MLKKKIEEEEEVAALRRHNCFQTLREVEEPQEAEKALKPEKELKADVVVKALRGLRLRRASRPILAEQRVAHTRDMTVTCVRLCHLTHGLSRLILKIHEGLA